MYVLGHHLEVLLETSRSGKNLTWACPDKCRRQLKYNTHDIFHSPAAREHPSGATSWAANKIVLLLSALQARPHVFETLASFGMPVASIGLHKSSAAAWMIFCSKLAKECSSGENCQLTVLS